VSGQFSPPARDGFTAFFDDAALAPRPNLPRLPSVIALIEDDQGRLLLDRRADAPVWALIGGSLEDDETFVEALRREVQEETGLDIVDYEFFGTFSDPGRVIAYPDGNIFQLASLAYRVRVNDPSALRASSESTELRFFTKAELPPDDLAATHRSIIRRYLGDEPPPFFD
jgi:8-oxo-dGTP pyrophosphatase MutT (NUDIX family)